jgi:hypothetical protein
MTGSWPTAIRSSYPDLNEFEVIMRDDVLNRQWFEVDVMDNTRIEYGGSGEPANERDAILEWVDTFIL